MVLLTCSATVPDLACWLVKLRASGSALSAASVTTMWPLPSSVTLTLTV